MDVREFTLAALPMLGAKVAQEAPGIYLAEERTAREYIRFESGPDDGRRTTACTATAPAFQRLVKRTIASGVHDIDDLDPDAAKASEVAAQEWASRQGARLTSAQVTDVRRMFLGEALLRVRATVAHDSYERIVSCRCEPDPHFNQAGQSDLGALPPNISDAAILGLDVAQLKDAAERETKRLRNSPASILSAANTRWLPPAVMGANARKLEDEFTPRIDITLVGVQGSPVARGEDRDAVRV